MDNDQHGGAIMTKTTEERLDEVERIQNHSMQIIKTAGGKLAHIKPDATLEEVIKILQEIGNNLLSVGNRGR